MATKEQELAAIRESDATFVQQARELAEESGKESAEFLAKGHKEVARLHQKLLDKKFEAEQEDILGGVPEEFKSAIRILAWDEGHSAGHREVLGYVQKYAEAFEGPIAEYTKRING